jgi:hypothetical protein
MNEYPEYEGIYNALAELLRELPNKAAEMLVLFVNSFFPRRSY